MCDCGLSSPASGVMTENSSGKQVCCLLERVVKEREHLGYIDPFVMHDMKKSEEEISESGVKQLTFGRWGEKGISTKFFSPAWLQGHECLCCSTLTQLPHRNIPGKTLMYLD